MNVTFIVQARMGSSRLPNKILLPFYKDKCILDLLVEKLQQVPGTQIVIATSTNANNDILEERCKRLGIQCFRGSENDVLQRFIDAAEAADAEKIIRICSDNPFLELGSIIRLVEAARMSDCDYLSFNVNGSPSIKTHYGFWAEYTTLRALKKVASKTSDKLYHEHVTNYIYSHPDEFAIEWIEGPIILNGRDDIRLTCDTVDDFNSAKEIYAKLCAENPFPKIEDVVHYLDQHSEYKEKMIEQIKNNSK